MNTRTRNAISRLLGVDAEEMGGGIFCWVFYHASADGRALYFGDPDTAPLSWHEERDGELLRTGEYANATASAREMAGYIRRMLGELGYTLADAGTHAPRADAPAPAIAAAPLPVPLVRCTLVRERVATDADIVDGARTAARIVSAVLGGADREHFVLIALDARRRALGVNIVSIGTVTASLVHPREVFKPAILLGACAVVVAHNHPSGNTEPSSEDREVTRRLSRAGELLGIPVADHVIVGDGAGEYFSFRERGLL